MNEPFRFRPRLLDTLKNYTAQDFSKDLAAGLTVGVVALSLAMALRIASGATPAAGIYTAIVAGFPNRMRCENVASTSMRRLLTPVKSSGCRPRPRPGRCIKSGKNWKQPAAN